MTETVRIFFIMIFFSTPLAASAKSSHLLHATVTEVPIEECQKIYDKTYGSATLVNPSFDQGVTNDIICARNESTNADTCQGRFKL